MTKEKKFAKEYARELLAVARLDLESARDLHRAGSERVENVFHNELSEFAAIRRYRGGREEFTPEEVEQVLDRVEDALAWCEARVHG